MMRRLWIELALGALLLLPQAAIAADDTIAQLDKFIEEMRVRYRVPGAAVAVVQDGKVVLARGYGVREFGKPAAVDADTIFQLASVTKTLTGAVAAALVGEGKLGWDDAVSVRVPEFVAYDPYVTRYLTLRDLLAQRTGFPAFTGDILDPMGYSRAEILQRLRYLRPAYSLREVAQYSNPGYFLAGEVAARAGGASWEQLVQEKLLAPLAMRRSGALSANLDRDANVSANHVIVGDRTTVVPATRADALGASGSASASVADMANFARMLLDRGRFGGRQVLKEEPVVEMFKRSMTAEISFTELPPIDETTGFYYGLGVDSFDYAGVHVIEKAGALAGVRTVMTLVPARSAAIVVFANLNVTTLPEAIRAYFLDTLLGRPTADHQAMIAEKGAQIVKLFAPLPPPPTPGPFRGRLDSLVGTYTNDLYGRCAIVAAGDALAMECGPARYRGTLRHYSNGLFILQFPNATATPQEVTFAIGEDGNAVSFTTDGLGLFTRVKPPATAAR